MVSRVVVHRPAEIISFEHIGVLHKSKEVFDNPEAKKWQGARETYTVRDEADGTRLHIEVDVIKEYETFMKDAWIAALDKVKALAEVSPVPA